MDLDWDVIPEPIPSMTIFPNLFVFERPIAKPIQFPSWVKESDCETHSHTNVVRTRHGIITETVSYRNGKCWRHARRPRRTFRAA